MPRVITNNGYIGYDEAGGGHLTPIVFLHGVGSDKSVWHPQLDHFGRTRRAVAFDYPGYGDSDPAPKGTTRDDYASAIISAMHELGIDRAHICGLSLGGVIAIAMHHAAPERCDSLILADTFAMHPEGRAIYERSVTASENLRALAEARVDVLLAQPAAQLRSIIRAMATATPRPKARRATIMRRRSSRRCTSSASIAHTSAGFRSAESSRSRCTMRRPNAAPR
jgi:3-oxoadipate enol-lactonase